MVRCLIVANQTLGGAQLDRAVRDSIGRGVKLFYVLVPVTPVEHETPKWTGGFAVGNDVGWSPDAAEHVRQAVEENVRRQEAARQEERRRAASRLDQMIEKITSAGGAAEGQLGDADPLEATREVLERQSFDEVIVSTLPSGLSRWLKMDLPHRVARLTDAPVTTVEAESDEVKA